MSKLLIGLNKNVKMLAYKEANGIDLMQCDCDDPKAIRFIVTAWHGPYLQKFETSDKKQAEHIYEMCKKSYKAGYNARKRETYNFLYCKPRKEEN